MREIIYAGGSFLTSDPVADAVLRYAAALANAGRAATIRVPAVGPKGFDEVEVLIGPTSQIVSEPSDQDGSGPDGTEFIATVDELVRSHEYRFTVPDDTQQLDWDI